jgi:hypothetical protein
MLTPIFPTSLRYHRFRAPSISVLHRYQAEGHALQSMGNVKIDMAGQDVDTMVLVMSLIQGRFRWIPSYVNLITLTIIAALVDYLD